MMVRYTLLCDIVSRAETDALRAAARVAEHRAHVSIPRRRAEPLPKLHILDARLSLWLWFDGRIERGQQGQTLLRTSGSQLIGLTDDDINDSLVLGAYLRAFATALATDGYRTRLVSGLSEPPRLPRSGSDSGSRSQPPGRRDDRSDSRPQPRTTRSR